VLRNYDEIVNEGLYTYQYKLAMNFIILNSDTDIYLMKGQNNTC